ncbi:hypothetical protein BZG36_01541 [Bifiguratus adelaidae]|uniref:assimilatory sulfite reductase (NADPH) n=1 Tax=Bifiguratus adelaidae TaxID=1938954 RepID=A0A261Y3W2_9FUNG|nr:hypothetical protein BZG36_01541 [Bifiguratus adelaidae]
MFATTALVASAIASKLNGYRPDAQVTAKDIPHQVVEKVTTELNKAISHQQDNSDDNVSTTSSQTIYDESSDATYLKSALVDSFLEEALFSNSSKLENASAIHLLSGKNAIEYIAFALSDLSFVYSAFSTDYLGKSAEQWAQSGIQNVSRYPGKVIRMDTRAGALTAVQGAINYLDNVQGQAHKPQLSILTSSESLLAMIPNMHALALQRAPVVFHVSAHGLSSELERIPSLDTVLAARNTGFVYLASNSVQEAHDMALVAYLVSQELQLPVLHYIDGVKTANESESINIADYTAIKHQLRGSADVTVPLAQTGDAIEAILERTSKAFGRRYQMFEYSGHKEPDTVIVTLGAGSQSVQQALRQLNPYADRVGVLNARVFRPWSEERFLEALPHTTKRIIVLEQSELESDVVSNGPLYMDVACAVRFGQWVNGAKKPDLVAAKGSDLARITVSALKSLVFVSQTALRVDLESEEFAAAVADNEVVQPTAKVHSATFWDVNGDETARHIAHLLAGISSGAEHLVNINVIEDSYRPGGPVTHATIRLSTETSQQPATVTSEYIAVQHHGLVKEYDILGSAATKAIVLLNGPWSTGDEIESKLPADFKLVSTQKDIQLYTIDAAKIARECSLDEVRGAKLVFELAYLNLVNSKPLKRVTDFTSRIAGLYDDVVGSAAKEVGQYVKDINSKVEQELKKIDLLPPWTILESEFKNLPKIPVSRAAKNEDKTQAQVGDVAQINKYHQAAFNLMFKEAYNSSLELRPDQREQNFLVTVTENKRLTPTSYDRNVFHLEFDTTNTGLKYDIGEALGVHGHNDEQEVAKFLSWYGLKGSDVVQVPVNGESSIYETRTILQLFTQTLDVFGRPTKKFYEELAEFATDEKEKGRLLFLVSDEGKAEYKKRVDDTVTYNDVLHEFTSAKPPVERLVRMISHIKPRHYSIASSQRMHPNSVHLLVVAVDWKRQDGEVRYGQCTRYLANLKVGDKVTVSIKPSVMKLPPRDTQPIIMAGLGTGMAPFRAFLQERAVAKASGVEVGPIVLYFGSRHRSMEYLYGEELEAYHEEGLLSHLGLAFSRDQKEKIYIQMKMQEDGKMLHDYLMNQEGYFYLCGPTWPVPDVKAAIMEGLREYGGIENAAASELIEEWKEKERYILEVY